MLGCLALFCECEVKLRFWLLPENSREDTFLFSKKAQQRKITAVEKKRAPWQGEDVFLPSPLVLPQGLSPPLAISCLFVAKKSTTEQSNDLVMVI